jgi:sugar O-acyltransferase (sialic acid O-acetyltransferase NeuD family)
VEKVVLYGNGAVAISAYLELKSDSPYEVVAFTVDRALIESSALRELPLVPFDEIEARYPTSEFKMMIAVGYAQGNKVRAEKYHQAKSMGYQMIRHISSTAIIAPDVVVGENSMIGENCIISNLARIGDNVRIGAGCFIGHDTVIGDHCFLANCAVVGGGACIEPYCFIGLNATVRNKITIAKHCVIGAGAVILQNTKEKQVFLARPAELLPVSSDDLPLM